jgi:hypothetical protein
MDTARCSECGSEALATVVRTDTSGERQLRTYCQACQARLAEEDRNELRWLGAMVARLLVYGGIVLAVLTLSADYLHISGHSGIGWRQITGVEIGCIAVLLGLLARRHFVAVSGLFLLLLSIGADLLRVGHAPGFGWRERMSFVVATAMLVGGILWRRALERPLAVGVSASGTCPGSR